MNQWTEVRNKRKATSPIVNRGKESRSELSEGTMADKEETQAGLSLTGGTGNEVDISQGSGSASGFLSAHSSRRSSASSKSTYSTVTQKSSKETEPKVRESVFTTSKPEGAFRDEIIVELQTIDDQVFRGSITLKEARQKIFQEILGFKREDLSGLIMNYSGGQIVTYKLHSQFNIDQLASVQFFNLERKMTVGGEEKISILKCKIRGIRTEQRVHGEAYEDTGLRYVKVEGCEYRVEKEQIIAWLSSFGEIKSELTEDVYEGSDDSENDMPLGNGIYSVRMKIEKDMPQFMPMQGKRVRLYYRGITKRCTNCFQQHQRKFCKNEKVPWSDYVARFAELFPEIPHDMYGKWETMIKVGEHREREEKSDTENTIKPQEDNPKTSNMQSGSQPNKEITGVAGNSHEGGTGEEDEDDENGTEEEELSKMIKKMLASGISMKTIQKKIGEESKQEKSRQKTLGKGRGRGGGRAKNK
jgi:hypothetical protein